MANKRIKDLTEKSTFASGDYFPVDNNNGTKKVDAGKITVPLGNISGSSDAYSSTKAYKVGDMVIHDNVLYKCTTACSAGTWQTNQGYFTATTLASAVTTVNASLTNYDLLFTTGNAPTSAATTTHTISDINKYKFVMIVGVANSTGDAVWCTQIPVSVLKSLYANSFIGGAYQGALIGLIKYVSNTSCQFKQYGSGSNYGYHKVYGIY